MTAELNKNLDSLTERQIHENPELNAEFGNVGEGRPKISRGSDGAEVLPKLSEADLLNAKESGVVASKILKPTVETQNTQKSRLARLLSIIGGVESGGSPDEMTEFALGAKPEEKN